MISGYRRGEGQWRRWFSRRRRATLARQGRPLGTTVAMDGWHELLVSAVVESGGDSEGATE